MNYPEEVIQALKSHVERMTETQVVDNLRAVDALRHHEREMLAWVKSVSLVPTEDCTDEINQLKSALNLYRRPPAAPLPLWDLMEEALKKRLETLRKRPNSNS